MKRLWRAYQRRIDRVILWPAIKSVAKESYPDDWLWVARGMMAEHARNDPAWRALPAREIVRLIEELPL